MTHPQTQHASASLHGGVFIQTFFVLLRLLIELLAVLVLLIIIYQTHDRGQIFILFIFTEEIPLKRMPRLTLSHNKDNGHIARVGINVLNKVCGYRRRLIRRAIQQCTVNNLSQYGKNNKLDNGPIFPSA